MKSIIIIPLLFLCVFVQAQKKDLVDRVYPSIEKIDTINFNCRIIKKYKPQKQIVRLLSVVDGGQDTILIVADKSENKKFKVGKEYAFSLVRVRKYAYKIIRNGYLIKVSFDGNTKQCVIIPYINKVKPMLYILLKNNGAIASENQQLDISTDSFEDNRLNLLDSVESNPYGALLASGI